MTSCSGHDMLFSFDPATVLERESGNHTSLSVLGWPSAISDDFQTFSITTKSMGLFYCVGAGIAGITILVRFGLLVNRKSRQSILEAAALFVSFTTLLSEIYEPVMLTPFSSALLVLASPRLLRQSCPSNSST